jgi:hypothetical protein
MIKELLRIIIALLILYILVFFEQYSQDFDLITYVLSCIGVTLVFCVLYGYLLYKRWKYK